MLDITKRLYNALLNPTIFNTKGNTGMYPASASIKIGDKVIGTCHRQEWYRWYKFKVTDPIDPEITLIGKTGDSLHTMVVSMLKDLTADTNIAVLSAEQSFFDFKELISGRIDILLKDLTDGSLHGCDIKSVGDFKSGMVAEEPDIPHILQCAVYLDQYNKSAAINNSRKVDSWIILYLARSENYKLKKYPHSSNFKYLWQFSIDLSAGYITVTDQLGRTKEYKDITMDNIYSRYRTLMNYIKLQTLPPREFEYQYSEERITGMYENKELNKANTTTVKEWLDKGAKPGELGIDMGDFACRYCAWTQLCYSATPEAGEKNKPILYNIPAPTEIVAPTKKEQDLI